METVKVAWLRGHAGVPEEAPAEEVAFEVTLDDPEAAWAMFDAVSGALRAAAEARRHVAREGS